MLKHTIQYLADTPYKKGINIHAFRHLVATHYYNAGARIEDVALMLCDTIASIAGFYQIRDTQKAFQRNHEVRLKTCPALKEARAKMAKMVKSAKSCFG